MRFGAMAWNRNGIRRCPKDCPNRAPGCHNIATCENWAAQMEQQRKNLEAKRAAYTQKRMSWEARASIERGARK